MKRIALFAALTCLFALWQFPGVARAGEASEALAEVNAWRAARGLPPFEYDEGLTRAAAGCARHRAQSLCFGHTSNDFAALPAGCQADSAGCAAYPDSLGWLSCCMTDHRRYGGAAWVRGADGKRYMHLFVASRPNHLARATADTQAAVAAADRYETVCVNGHCYRVKVTNPPAQKLPATGGIVAAAPACPVLNRVFQPMPLRQPIFRGRLRSFFGR